MPRGTAFDLEVFKVFGAKTVKKSGEETLVVWTPGEKHRFRLLGFVLSVSAETTVKLLDGANVFMEFLVPAKTNTVVALPGQGYVSTTNANKLQLELAAEAAITGTFYGVED